MSANVIARRFASVPVRSASATWSAIVEMLAPDAEHPARVELAAASGVAVSAIASESLAEAPLVVFGNGPRIRIRCVYGEEAVTGEVVNEDPIAMCPVEGDWRLSIPCQAEDLEWMAENVKRSTARISVRSVNEDVPDSSVQPQRDGQLRVNLAEFFKP